MREDDLVGRLLHGVGYVAARLAAGTGASVGKRG
jgi:hypothetical protein